jgi:hypothetical protein
MRKRLTEAVDLPIVCPLQSDNYQTWIFMFQKLAVSGFKREESDFEKHTLNLVCSWNIP